MTLPDDTWEWIDQKAGDNRSALIRYLIGRERSPEREPFLSHEEMERRHTERNQRRKDRKKL